MPDRPVHSTDRVAVRLRERREGVLAAWRVRVLADPLTPEANRLSEPALRDHIPCLVDRLADALDGCRDDREQAEAHGRAVADANLARAHARDRARQGYSLVAAMREVSILRLTIGDAIEDLDVRVGHAALVLIESALDEVTLHLADELSSDHATRTQTDARRAAQAALHGDIGIALTRTDGLRDLLQLCAEALVARLDAAFARIWTLEHDADVLVLDASAGMYTHLDGAHGRVPVGAFKIGRIAQSRTPHLTNEVQGDPEVGDQAWAAREGMVSFAGYPLVVDGRLVGVMALFAKHPLAFDTLDALQSVSSAIALGIDRRRATHALHVSEHQLATTLQSIGDAVIATDAEGRVVFTNPVASELTGWSADEAKGEPLDRVFDIVNEETRETVESPVGKVLREGTVVALANHTVLRRRDGTEVGIDDSAAPIRDEDGTLTGVVLVFRDVSEHRRAAEAEAALAAENQLLFKRVETERNRLNEVLAQAPVGIAILRGANHVFELANTHYMPLVGLGRELLGKPVREALPEVEGQGFFELLDRVYATGEAFVGNELLLQVDSGEGGAKRDAYVNFVYQPLRGTDGDVEGIVAVVIDVTAQVLARKRTEALAAELEAVFASVPDALVVADERGVRRANQAALDLYGAASPEEFASDAFARASQLAMRDANTGRPVAPGSRAIVRALRGERATDEMILRQLNSGADVYVRVSAAPIMVEGRSTGAVVIGTDITASRKQQTERAELFRATEHARREAESANELKDQFLATVSHELRTPLNAMLGWLRLLRAGQVKPEQRDRTIETIERNARAQAQLIEDLLDISRIVAGKLRIESAPTDLGAVLATAIDVVQPAATAKSIVLALGDASQPTTVMGDAARLQQIVWNLLANAVKFTPRGGSVTVESRTDGSIAEVSVTDTGAGIPPEFLPHVFERFRQAEGTMERTHGGLGLGLAIVKNLVELHGGTVRAESPGLGHGATFTVRLPVLERGSSIPARPSYEPGTPTRYIDYPDELAGLSVLVLEDDDDAREVLTALLEGGGATVTATATIADALDAITARFPDLIVSDIGLRGEDGYTFARIVRALPDPRARRMPLVALTAYARSEDRSKALRSGFTTHVPKPIDANEILAVLASLAPRGNPH